MTIGVVCITNAKGKVIIKRDYRAFFSPSCMQKFSKKIQETEEQDLKPIFTEGGVSYVYVRHEDLYLVALTKRNANAMMVLQYLYGMIEVFTSYFGHLDEESIRDNFVIVYELMDEMMDFGFPQSTDHTILQQFITQEGSMSKFEKAVPTELTNAVSWRKEGIFYKKNEIFLDVIEKLSIMVNPSGKLVYWHVDGRIRMKSYLSGMPELKLGLNDKVLFEQTGRRSRGKAIDMDDMKFHQCVQLSRFESDRTISFIPPDGEFDLMTYRISSRRESKKPLIWVETLVEPHGRSRIEYLVKTKSQFKSKSIANNVQIVIPVPSDVDSPTFKASIGTCKYVPDRNAMIWEIKQFYGNREFIMRAHFGLPSVSANDLKEGEGVLARKAEWKKPITVNFEIPYYTVSGIQVRYLKIVEKSGYQALPWVRYITQDGEYQLRMG